MFTWPSPNDIDLNRFKSREYCIHQVGVYVHRLRVRVIWWVHRSSARDGLAVTWLELFIWAQVPITQINICDWLMLDVLRLDIDIEVNCSQPSRNRPSIKAWREHCQIVTVPMYMSSWYLAHYNNSNTLVLDYKTGKARSGISADAHNQNQSCLQKVTIRITRVVYNMLLCGTNTTRNSPW